MVEYPTNTAFPDIEKANDYLENHLIEIRDTIYSDHPGIDACELEVLTYLKSRNIDCGREVEIVAFHYWEMEYRAFINASSEYNKVDNRSNDLSIEDAEASELFSTPIINFWNEYSDDKYSDDSYFLRFIDWCKIDDFKEIWINRIVKEYSHLSSNEEISPNLLGLMIFNHCRSDYSLRLLKGSLLKILSKYESIYFDQNGELITYKKDFIDFQAIAIIVFANIRLKTANLRVIKEGLRILTDNQIKNGGWSVNNKKKESDLLTSAVVIHAMAIAQKPYWQITINPCIEWIKSEQNVFGVWTSKVFVQIPLVVMILDALELAKGSTKVTFTIDKLLVLDTIKKQINTKVEAKKGNLLRWEGIVWTVIYNGKKVRIKDTIGMHIIAHLLKFQGQEFRADEIYKSMASSEIPVDDNYSNMSSDQLKEQENIPLDYENKEKLTYVDGQTIREARERIENIDIELEDIVTQEDIDKVNLLVSEKTNIESYLNMVTDKSGKPREIPDRIEKSRKAAIQAVKTAKNNVKKENLKLFLHLDEFLKIRLYSLYMPKPDISWVIEK